MGLESKGPPKYSHPHEVHWRTNRHATGPERTRQILRRDWSRGRGDPCNTCERRGPGTNVGRIGIPWHAHRCAHGASGTRSARVSSGDDPTCCPRPRRVPSAGTKNRAPKDRSLLLTHALRGKVGAFMAGLSCAEQRPRDSVFNARPDADVGTTDVRERNRGGNLPAVGNGP